MEDFARIDVALSAWSIFVQLMINFPLFLLFVLSWFTVKKKIFSTWSLAWGLNLVALGMVLIISNFFINTTSPTQIIFYAIYGATKILFAIVLVISALQFSQKNEVIAVPPIFLFSIGMLLWVIFLMFHPVEIQFTVYGLVCLFLYSGVFLCFKREKSIECRVVAIGFFIDGTVFLHHFVVLFSWFTRGRVPVYMSRISFFDSISEFILALTFFLGVIIRSINELREANAKLEKNQENLRTLVDIDPLTGLKNRRVLRMFFEEIKGKEGCLAFIDVNKFKQINDNWGHEVGDKCLIALARKMKKVFRVEDGLFRIGGDEFLIVCPEISEEEMRERLKKFRKEIKHSVKGVSLNVAIGVERFCKASHIDEVLKIADKKMYGDKRSNN